MDAAIVVITGPESSGKTTITRHLSYRYKTTWIPEYARHYLSRIADPAQYTLDDVERMVEGTDAWIRTVHPTVKKLLLVDTCRMVFEVWGDVRFGQRPKNIDTLPTPDLYLLCAPDIPYESDLLREHPEQRDMLYDKYVERLNDQNVPYVILQGDHEQRMVIAEKAINKMRSQRRSATR